MKTRPTAESKTAATQTNTNHKKQPETDPGAKPIESSMFKKNEFALILFGALLLTLIIFFLFFRSPDEDAGINHNDGSSKIAGAAIPQNPGSQSSSFNDIEKRIEKLESLLLDQTGRLKSGALKAGEDSDPIKARVSRLETAFEVKFDTLTEKMTKIEKRLQALKQVPSKPVPEPAAVKIKTPAVLKPKPKAAPAPEKKSLFHTVKKGETLYSIGKKYNISISNLRKLNKLSEKEKIYPGTNLMVR